MKSSHRGTVLLVATMALGMVDGNGTAFSAARHARRPGYRAGSVLVKFRPGIAAAAADDIARSLGAESVQAFPRPRWMGRGPIDSWRHLEVGAGRDTSEFLREIAALPEVERAELDYEVSVDEEPAALPNDPWLYYLWGLRNFGQTGGTPGADIHAPQAWDSTTGSSAVVVAVIDTGVDYTHPDLAANIWTNPGEIPGNGLDDDGNGYVDDVHGYDFVNHDGDPFDDHGHGTHVAGTIAAVGNNGIGVVGVNWQARVMALKFLNAGGSGSTSDAVNAVLYAANMHAKVMNNSWGGGGYSQALRDAIATAMAPAPCS